MSFLNFTLISSVLRIWILGTLFLRGHAERDSILSLLQHSRNYCLESIKWLVEPSNHRLIGGIVALDLVQA
jgi:hypothetical protein